MKKKDLLKQFKTDAKKIPIEPIEKTKATEEFQEISKNFEPSSPRINSPRFRRFSLAFSFLILLFIASVFIFYKKDITAFENFLFININPSIEFKLDENEIITAQKPLNKDGIYILAGEDFIGLKAEKALERVVTITQKLGYLNQNDILITNVCSDKAKEKSNNQIFSSNLTTFLNNHNMTNPIKTGYDESLEKESKEYKVSIAKMKIINEVHQKAGTPKKELAKLSVDDLKEILEDYDEDYLKGEEDRINGQFSEEFKLLKDKINHLKVIENELENLEKLLDKNSHNFQKKLEDFNLKYPDYSITYKNDDNYLEEKIEDMLDKLDDEMDALEDQLDLLKEAIKQDDDKDDDDEPEDEDD